MVVQKFTKHLLYNFFCVSKKKLFFIDNILLPIGALAQWSVNLTPDLALFLG